MKKILCLGSFIAMILGATGCDRNNIEPEDKMVTKVLYAINSDTKTSLEGKDIVWEKGDTVCCVAVYEDNRLNTARYAVYSNIRPTEMNGTSARIEVTCGSAFTPAYIVYPTSDLVTYTSGQLNIPVPESYTMVKDNIPSASNIAVGTVEQDNVYMKNAMALMKFEVAYPEGMNEEVDGIKQIVISSNAGEAISGTLTYDPAENKVTATEGSSKLYLYPPTDEPYFPAGVYYFPLPSISLSQGLKVKVSRGDNWVAGKSYAQAYDLKRNSIINMGKTSDWGLKYENTVRTLHAVFSKDGAKVGTGWAFNGTEPNRANDVCGKGIVGPYYLPDNDDAPFYFFVAKEVSSDSWRTTGGAGRRFGGTVHDYMLMPAINGYRLSAVYLKAGSGSSTYAITNNPSSGDPVPVAGGDKHTIAKQGEYTFILSGTEVNTAYRLDLPTTTCAGILEFQLSYEMD